MDRLSTVDRKKGARSSALGNVPPLRRSWSSSGIPQALRRYRISRRGAARQRLVVHALSPAFPVGVSGWSQAVFAVPARLAFRRGGGRNRRNACLSADLRRATKAAGAGDWQGVEGTRAAKPLFCRAGPGACRLKRHAPPAARAEKAETSRRGRPRLRSDRPRPTRSSARPSPGGSRKNSQRC